MIALPGFVSVRVLNVPPIRFVIAVVFPLQTSVEIIIPARVVRLVASPCRMAEAECLLVVLKCIVRSGGLLQRVVDVLIHIARIADAKVRLGLFPVVCEGLFNPLPRAEVFVCIVARLVAHFAPPLAC